MSMIFILNNAIDNVSFFVTNMDIYGESLQKGNSDTQRTLNSIGAND